MDDPQLPAAWRSLQDRGGVTTPFLLWEWVRCFAGAGGERVRVLAVHEGSELVGAFPVERAAGPGPLTTLGPAGWRWLAPDHLDVVASADYRPAVATALVEHLAADRGWDVLDLDGLASGGALAVAVATLRPPRYVRWAEEPVRSPYVMLRGVDGSALTDRELVPSKNLRRQVGRGLRVAEGLGGGLDEVTGPDEVVSALQVLMRLHDDRFGSASAVFATAARRRFHTEAARGLAGRGSARVYRLRTGTGDAGLLYVLRLGDIAYAYASGMALGTTLSPGRTVYGQALLSAAREGLAEFDLLRGEHDYKVRFSHGTRVDVRHRVARATPRLALAAATRVPARARAALIGLAPSRQQPPRAPVDC